MTTVEKLRSLGFYASTVRLDLGLPQSTYLPLVAAAAAGVDESSRPNYALSCASVGILMSAQIAGTTDLTDAPFAPGILHVNYAARVVRFLGTTGQLVAQLNFDSIIRVSASEAIYRSKVGRIFA